MNLNISTAHCDLIATGISIGSSVHRFYRRALPNIGPNRWEYRDRSEQISAIAAWVLMYLCEDIIKIENAPFEAPIPIFSKRYFNEIFFSPKDSFLRRPQLICRGAFLANIAIKCIVCLGTRYAVSRWDSKEFDLVSGKIKKPRAYLRSHYVASSVVAIALSILLRRRCFAMPMAAIAIAAISEIAMRYFPANYDRFVDHARIASRLLLAISQPQWIYFEIPLIFLHEFHKDVNPIPML